MRAVGEGNSCCGRMGQVMLKTALGGLDTCNPTDGPVREEESQIGMNHSLGSNGTTGSPRVMTVIEPPQLLP